MRGVLGVLIWVCVSRLYRTLGRSKAIVEHKFDRKREQFDHPLFDIITGPIDNHLYVR